MDSFVWKHTKPFYIRVNACRYVTLIMLSQKAFESLRKNHEKILWQEKIENIGNAIIQRLTAKYGSLKKH